MRPPGNHQPHAGLIWRPAESFGYELTIDGFTQPLGRAVRLPDGRWRTVARAPGRPKQGATAGSEQQARQWLTAWATPIAWRHRPIVPTGPKGLTR
ncbi:hypothetical protein GCM10027431_32610 [Lysobacter rhizosphaerae]